MKKRVLSAIIMILIFVPLLFIGGIPFAILMTVLALGAMYELINIREKKKEFPTLIKIISYLLIIFSLVLTYNQNIYSYNISYQLISFIILLFLLPILLKNKKEMNYDINDALYLVGSLLFINIAFNLILVVRNYSLNYLIYLLLITVITDTFALITGMYIGKNKLAPTISPNKTIEGFIGGVLMGTFVATTFYYTVIDPGISLAILILTTLFLAVVGQLGDLVFSSIKRTFNVKDFSNLIPGHGGILDRLDSLIFVILAFILVMGLI
mgnify:FL=1